jgi:acetyl esterase
MAGCSQNRKYCRSEIERIAAMTGAREISVADVTYRESETGSLLARLYRPAGDGPFPAIVSVHGGRWVSQSRLTNEVMDRRLSQAGIVVMALDFRMPPVARYPESIADINFAIRWLKRSAELLGSNAAVVGGIGTSSGGHQIMLNALRPDDPRFAAIVLPDSNIEASLAYVIACWPVLDPLERYRMAKRKNMELHAQSHDAYWPDEASMSEGNPQSIVERGEAKKMPPALLIQGTADTTVPPEMTQRFADTYRAHGGMAVLQTFAGQPHTFITKQPDGPASHEACSAVVSFVMAQTRRFLERGPAYGDH